MDLDEKTISKLKALSKTFALRFGSPGLEGDVLGSLVEIALTDPSFQLELSNPLLSGRLARMTMAGVHFHEIGESSLRKDGDDEDMPTALDLATDGQDAETIILNYQDLFDEEIQLKFKKEKAHREIMRLEPMMSAKEERVFHLLYGLGFSVEDTASFCECTTATVRNIVKRYHRKRLDVAVDAIYGGLEVEWIKI